MSQAWPRGSGSGRLGLTGDGSHGKCSSEGVAFNQIAGDPVPCTLRKVYITMKVCRTHQCITRYLVILFHAPFVKSILQ